MRATSLGWSLAAMILVHGSAAWAKEKKPAPPTAEELVVGDGYALRVERNGVRKQFQGDLVKLTDRWIVLKRGSVSRVSREVPVLSTIPLVGSAFHSTSHARADEFLWIPREAATAIEKRVRPAKPVAVQAPAMDAPPTKISCVVDAVVGGKIIQREGGMQVVKDDHVSLSVATKERRELPAGSASILMTAAERDRKQFRFSRERFARQDILCVHVPDLDAALRAALAH